MNAIGTGNMKYTSVAYSNLTTNTEFKKCLAEVKKKAADADLFAIGLTLGGTRMIKLAAEGKNCPFKAMVSVSTLFDLN